MKLVECPYVPNAELSRLVRLGFEIHQHQHGSMELPCRKRNIALIKRALFNKPAKDAFLQGKRTLCEDRSIQCRAPLIGISAHFKHAAQLPYSLVTEKRQVTPPNEFLQLRHVV